MPKWTLQQASYAWTVAHVHSRYSFVLCCYAAIAARNLFMREPPLFPTTSRGPMCLSV